LKLSYRFIVISAWSISLALVLLTENSFDRKSIHSLFVITRHPVLHSDNPIAMLTDAAIADMHKTNISLPFTMFITKHNPQKIPKAKFTGFLILTYASLQSLISNSGHHDGRSTNSSV
jgi:hypothetical protein